MATRKIGAHSAAGQSRNPGIQRTCLQHMDHKQSTHPSTDHDEQVDGRAGDEVIGVAASVVIALVILYPQ